MKLLIYSGSSRKGNYTQYVADFVHKQAALHTDLEPTLIRPQEVGISFSDEGFGADYPQLQKQVEEADGFIAVTPEYNHGYSATIKYLLDLNLKGYIHKPIAFVGVSSGVFGGARAIEMLVTAVREMGLIACFNDVNFGNVESEIVNGEVVDPEKWGRRCQKMITELVWMMNTLKQGRTEHQ